MAEPFIGQIILVGFNFAPRGWALCNGQLLSIASNTALFSLLGTTFGGNGTTNFALPDLRGRVPIHFGMGPGLSNYTMGEAAGTESVTLISTQIPAHNHSLVASSATPTTADPTGAQLPVGSSRVYATAAAGAAMAPGSIGLTGGSQPHPNMQPYLTMNYVIATEGIFPSRA